MLDAIVPHAAEALPAVAGVGGIGVGAAWLAHFLFKRMVDGYDKRIEALEKKSTEQGEKLAVVADRAERDRRDLNAAHAAIRDLKNCPTRKTGIPAGTE